MGSNPINLTVRFLLEIAALVIVGIWGWQQSIGFERYLYAFLLPLLVGAIWGTFNVPGDPSRSGKAPVKVAGWTRLAIELLIFLTATLALYHLGFSKSATLMGVVVIIHYAISYDRIQWLLKQ